MSASLFGGRTMPAAGPVRRTRLMEPWRRVRAAAAAQSVFFSFSGSALALNGANLIAGTLALRWIEPAFVGIWQTLVLAQSYFLVVRLGVLNGMNRELPFLLGRGERQRGLELAAAAQLHAVVCSALAVTAAGAALWACWAWGPDWRWAFGSMAVLAGATFYVGYLQATFRSSDDFRRLTRLQLTQAMTMLSLPVSTALWQFRGFCAHAALQAVIIGVFAHRIRPLRVEMRWAGTAIKLLLATGLPLFVSGYLQTIAAGMDRLILLSVAGTEALGYYAPALSLVGAMSIVPNALATYLYPKLSFRLGQGDSPEQLWRTAATATAISALVALPLVAIVWVSAPVIVTEILPAYARGVPAIRAASVTGFAAAASACTVVLGSLKHWTALYAYAAVLLGLKVALPWYGSMSADPVSGVAVGSMWASLLGSGVAIGLVYRSTHRNGGTDD
jgi:O-antigen/teichoic acid export membrane protein